jgi:hypothetical protein
MPNLHTPEGATYLLQTLVSAFLAILFLQSGIDKVLDRRGNLEWLTGHFAKSPLAGLVPLMLSVITLLELAAGGLSAVGCVLILVLRGSTLAFYGTLLRSARGQGLSRSGNSCSLLPADAGRDLFAHLVVVATAAK